ncbi:glutamine amidotransferase [Lutibaculum baratangense AMV1]|uniref:gamma-glutamyl-gamma-aminobutyrate hydrolase n=1 Tax=Lutibaculum baratangense AMV1 TaxID=631454 RepID=V4RNM5_9HYPH|nr:glutamine amidotransferase [Lutibaculum baratangense AMV1]
MIAVPADIRIFDNYRWHVAATPYVDAVARVAGTVPFIVPALGEALEVEAVLDRVDGVMLTGSKSNVHPAHYGVEPTERHGPFDEDRDATTLPLIRSAIDRGLPLLAICRGMQELNVALGGSIATEIQEIAGRDDHRAPDLPTQDERFALRHEVRAVPGGILAGIVGVEPFRVNSLHRQAIDRLAEGLAVEATAEDGTIEAVSVEGARSFALGVQWHPEYWAGSEPMSQRIFRAYGAALRGDAPARAVA